MGSKNPEKSKNLAEIEAGIRRRVACEERAHRLVEQLIDNPVTEEQLVDAVQYIQPSHYADVTVERAITKLCGYPLCPNPLLKQIKQKYHISLKQKKVYDVGERKNFCSNQCYKSSKCFEKQIPDTLVWMRENDPLPTVRLLPLDSHHNKGEIGDEVMCDPGVEVKAQLRELEELDRRTQTSSAGESKSSNKKDDNSAQHVPQDEGSAASTGPWDVSLQEFAEELSDFLLIERSKGDCDSVTEESSSSLREGEGAIDSSETYLMELTGIHADSSPPIHQSADELARDRASKQGLSGGLDGRQPESKDTNKDCVEGRQEEVAKPTKKSKKKSKEKQAGLRPLDPIRTALLAWTTAQTTSYLSQDEQVRNARGSSDFDRLYAELGERAGSLNIGDMVDTEPVGEKDEDLVARKGVPDMENIKQHTQQMDLKIREYFKGNMRYPVLDSAHDGQAESSQCDDKPKKEEEVEEREPVLPMIDAHSQTAIRRKIVSDKLDRVLPDLLVPLKLSVHDVGSELRELLHTFRFSATNITLRPAEWTLMAYLLLKILSVKVPRLRDAFKEEYQAVLFGQMMSSLNIREADIVSILDEIMHGDIVTT